MKTKLRKKIPFSLAKERREEVGEKVRSHKRKLLGKKKRDGEKNSSSEPLPSLQTSEAIVCIKEKIILPVHQQ